MADISRLGNLQPVGTFDTETYTPVKTGGTFQLPPRGRYTLQAPDSFPTEAFGATKAGYLSAKIDPTIVGPEHAGFQLRFTSVSAKPYPRKSKDGKETMVSQAGDYLLACGFRGTLKTPQDIANAIEQTANQTYEADLDWSAYNSKTGFRLEGMAKFPKKEDGTHQSWIEDPSELDENGKPVRLLAKLTIRNFVPAQN